MAEDCHEGEPAAITGKKQKRAEKKQKKLLAEFQLSKSNDAVKRPGELLDAVEANKKREKKDEPSVVTPGPSGRLNEEEFKLLKKQLAERKRTLTQLPRFNLQFAGLSAQLGTEENERVPLLMSDVQHLLVYALGGNDITGPPRRWCCLEKCTRITNVMALVVEGVTSQDFLQEKHHFPSLATNFPNQLEIMAPIHHDSCAAKEFAHYPITSATKNQLLQKYGSMEAVLEAAAVTQSFRSLFPIASQVKDTVGIVPAITTKLPPADMFPRTYLLLSTHQMMMENFPLPIECLNTEQQLCSYKMSRYEYTEAHPWSPMFALDCEMCFTEIKKLELTHIAVVNEKHETIYETLVKPHNKIINYLTQYSGITAEKLKNVNKRIAEVLDDLNKLLPGDAILIGHSLNSDLSTLGISHPYVIDTSIIFNMTGNRQRKSKLSHLVEQFLGENIQTSHKGHSPSEDALAAMKLVQLKLSKGFHFGDALATVSEPAAPPECQLTASVFATIAKAKKSVMIVGNDEHIGHYSRLKTFEEEAASFQMARIKKPRDAIKNMESASVTHNMCISHVDLTTKLAKCDSAEKKAKVFKKLDNWCERMFSLVSWNGLGVVVFAGPRANGSVGNEKEETGNVVIDNSVDSYKKGISAQKDGEGSSSDANANIMDTVTEKSRKIEERRAHGAAFIRIKTLK